MGLVQAALEAVAEQRAERLAGADAVEQGEREPHPSRREVEGERAVGPPPWARCPERRTAAVAACPSDGAWM